MDEPWIKLLLQARASRTWYTNRFSEAQAWVDLILIKVGKIVISERMLAKKWEWSRNTVHKFMKLNQQVNHQVNHTNPIKSTGNKETYTTKDTTKRATKYNTKYTTEFERFYEKYPRKKSKAAAFQAWQKNEKPSLEIILQAIENQIKEKKYLRSMPGRFCPEWKYPATWLNQKCWEDTVETSKREVSSFKPIPGHDPEAIEETKARLAKLTKNIGGKMS